jgi:exodeoxyribonuclease V gamma subunit
MLHLYQSNRLENLGALFTGMVGAAPLSDPFRPEVVMVQSRGMGRWLTMASARANGIAAHLEFVLPAGYAWRLMRRALPELPEQSAFSPDLMTWRLMALLPTLQEDVFAPISHYLQGGERAVFELAGRIADIYDQYLVFRPDWIRRWEGGELCGLGEDEAWQAALWRVLAAEVPGMHRVGMSDAFLAALTPDLLPERLTLFGIASLAPMYLALVRRLAELTDVCLFLLNPCAEYWGNLLDAKGQMRLADLDMDIEPEHPLLASLGKQGRDFFDLVTETAEPAKDFFTAPAGDALLARLQRDMLTLSAPTAGVVDPADASIEIHAVHGAMRELEVLKDRMLAWLAADPSLTPADIAVLTPDINGYAPYIEAVFGRRDDAPSLPWSIADRRIERDLPLLAHFTAILRLADGRMPADAVLSLCECPALLRRFGLVEADLPLLQAWVESAAIRWGRSAEQKAGLGLPADPMFTWRWGLDRLLLGSVLPPDMAGNRSPVFEGLLPQPVDGADALTTLGRFAGLVDTLTALVENWNEPASPAAWGERLVSALEALFEADGDEDEDALALLRETLDTLVRDSGQAAFAAPVGLPVLRDWLERRLTQADSGGFLSGGVTFCAMVPMRSIPFRVLCLIGMNDGAYPRDERPVSFDLIARHPKRGDRSRRFDDRYLFLEAMLSARDTLYLSYVGQAARSNEPLPPSPLVSELLDVLDGMGAPVERLTVQHSLQPFSPACYDGKQPALASFEPLFAEALRAPPRQPDPFAVALPYEPAREIELEAFLSFWSMPCRAWLSSRLGIVLRREREEVPVREPFGLDRDAAEAIVGQVVHARLEGRPLAPVAASARAGGMLPTGELGAQLLDGKVRHALRFAAGLPSAMSRPLPAPVPVRLALGEHELTGALSDLYPEGRLRVTPSRASAPARISLWLNHLLLCALRPDGIEPVSTLFALDGVFRLAPVDAAADLLTPWIAFWRMGQAAPLPFFPRTSLAFAAERLAHPDAPAEKALRKAQSVWSPSEAIVGAVAQKDDPAVALAFRHLEPLDDPLFAQLADVLLVPMLQALAAEGDNE